LLVAVVDGFIDSSAGHRREAILQNNREQYQQ